MTSAPQRESNSVHMLEQAPQFLLAGPGHTHFLERDPQAADVGLGAVGDPTHLLEAVRRRFIEGPNAGLHVVGAIPFDPRDGCALRISARVRSFPTVPLVAPTPRVPMPKQLPDEGVALDSARYVDLVERALVAIERGSLKKVVLARALDVPSGPVDVLGLVGRLRAQNPANHVFCVRLPVGGSRGPRVLLGATPERLVSRQGLQVTSGPLAGTAARSPDARLDQERRRTLLRSEKERREHQLVVEQIVRALDPLAKDIAVDAEPHVVGTKALWHLKTNIVGTLRSASTNALELALHLHPTPAVCGEPSSAAFEFIRKHEPFERDYFAGAVGYMKANGDGEWFVTLRCAELSLGRARLYAGAGIVAGSDPKREFEETTAKMETMLEHLRVEHE
jgi:isochorismate synthase